MRDARWIVGVAAALAMAWGSAALVGCESGGGRAPARSGPSGSAINGADPLALRVDLSDFGDYYSAMIAGTCSQIAASTKDRRIRELALLYKIRSIPRMRAMLIGSDPREALLRAWVVIAQANYQLTQGSMKTSFGDEQAYAQETMARLEEAIVELAYRHFPHEAVNSTRAEIDEFAATTPLGADLTPTDDIQILEAKNPGPLSILLVPLKPLSGVSDTAESLAQLAVVAQSATQVVKELPQTIRWQTEMLLLELDDMDTTTTLRNEIVRLGDQFEELSKTTDELPQRVREELEALLDKEGNANEQLAATLRDARAVTDGLNEAMAGAERASESVRATSVAAAQTADAWRATADATTRALDAVKALQGEGGGEGESVSFEQVAALAEQVRSAVEEARQLLVEVREPAPTDSAVRTLMDDAFTRTNSEMTTMLNGLLWRGIVLIGVAFVAALALRFVPKRKAA